MRMQEDLYGVKQWFEKNTLKLNQQKTEVLTFEMDRWEKAGSAVRLLGIYIRPHRMAENEPRKSYLRGKKDQLNCGLANSKNGLFCTFPCPYDIWH